MSLVYIDVTNSWKYSNFINSENASVMVVAMKRSSVWLIEAHVSGRLFRAWQ